MDLDIKKYRIGNVFVDDITCSEMYDSVSYSKKCSEPLVCFSMNGEGISHYNINKEFKNLINKADIVHPDGWSTMFAGRCLTKGKFIERVATTDCYKDLISACIDNGYNIFLLGSSQSEIEKACENLKLEFPQISIVGFNNGYFTDINKIKEKIDDTNAHFVLIGLGRPKQESTALFIKENCKNVKYIKTCGGLFNFLSGLNPRAPVFMQNNGLEWLFRLYNEPGRLFLRYLWTNIYSTYLYIFKSG